jgi:hypothetical protein
MVVVGFGELIVVVIELVVPKVLVVARVEVVRVDRVVLKVLEVDRVVVNVVVRIGEHDAPNASISINRISTAAIALFVFIS